MFSNDKIKYLLQTMAFCDFKITNFASGFDTLNMNKFAYVGLVSG